MIPFLAAALLTLRLSATVCFAPCSIRAEVIIPRHPDNRAWVIQLDGPLFRGSATTMDGDNAPVIQPEVWFKGLPPGEYALVVVLYRQGRNEVARVTRTVIVQ